MIFRVNQIIFREELKTLDSIDLKLNNQESEIFLNASSPPDYKCGARHIHNQDFIRHGFMDTP